MTHAPPQAPTDASSFGPPIAASQLVAAASGLLLGLALRALDASVAARWLWGGAILVVLVPAIVESARRLLRRQANVDVIAVLAMGAALALDELLAGAVIAAMLSGGSALEHYATTRARRELAALLTRAPRVVHRREGDQLVDVDAADVAIGDVLVAKAGEVIAADGILLSPRATLDESALTGESRPVELASGALVRSGATVAGDACELRVTARPADSTYAGIVRLVREAEQSKAPFVRMADRVAGWFLALTLVACAAAWIASGDPVRALAVLVVATPCPLIIAAPVALIGGVSRAARHGIIIKGGGPLEALAGATVVLLDKTGTVTTSRPELLSVESFGQHSTDALVRAAAAVEQLSVHPFAPAILAEASGRNLALVIPIDAREQTGSGIAGIVDGVHVAVGQLSWVAPTARRDTALRSIALRTAVEGSTAVYIALDGKLEGALLVHNPIRPEAPRVVEALRRDGIEAIHLVTGDHPDVAELVGDAIGADRVYAERAPEDKVEVLQQLASTGSTLMVGDGINDAPALALADVAVAMGARGASAASEAADIVLTTDRLEGLLTARQIARRTRRIARQSVGIGMGLSLFAMIFAALGMLPPIHGALAQELIDVLVIMNALRALTGDRQTRRRAELSALSRELTSAHRTLRPHVAELAAVAARLDTLAPAEARAVLTQLRQQLEDDLLPHELSEQQMAYPSIRRLLKSEDPTGPLIQTHHEIRRLTRLFGRLLDQLPAEGPDRDDLRDIRRSLYGLHAVLSLHFAQEDELYSMLEA